MARRHIVAALIVAAGAVLFAACSTPASSSPKPKAPLWKVTSAHRVMYITGAVGASLKKYPVPAVMAQAFAKSGELVLEGNPKPDTAKLLPLIMKLALQPSGKTLNDDLDPAQLQLVKKAYASVGVPFASAQRFRPWFAVPRLIAGLAAKEGAKPHALYVYFYDKAQARNLSSTFLNKASGELKSFASLPQEVQVAWLTKTAKDVLDPKRQEKHARMIQAWQRGDTSLLSEKLTKLRKRHPRLYGTLVTNDEPRWVKTLGAKLDEQGKPVFVVVNGDNLVGPSNILSGLRKAGYRVTQL